MVKNSTKDSFIPNIVELAQAAEDTFYNKVKPESILKAYQDMEQRWIDLDNSDGHMIDR